MAQFGASIQTAQVTTGNFRTTVDLYTVNTSSAPAVVYPEPNGQQNPLGTAYYDATGSLSNPWGVPGKYRYVRYNSTSNPALTSVTGPFLVYWTDATFTTVTPVSSESLTAGVNLPAGLFMPNPTALTTLTATILNGNMGWMCVGGYVSGVYIAAASLAAGALLVGTATNFQPVTASAATQRVFGVATTAGATNQCNVLVTLES